LCFFSPTVLPASTEPEAVLARDPRGAAFATVLAHLAAPIDTRRYEPRVAEDTGTVYFRDHEERGTTWEDPRCVRREGGRFFLFIMMYIHYFQPYVCFATASPNPLTVATSIFFFFFFFFFFF
jgi:hypothetical protein